MTRSPHLTLATKQGDRLSKPSISAQSKNMKIQDSERKFFNESTSYLQENFKRRSKADDRDSIGIDSFGFATLLAEYDVANSGDSGLYLSTLEKATAIAQALYVKQNMTAFIEFAQSLIDVRAVSYSTAVVLNGCDRKGYCVKRKATNSEPEYFEVFIANQSTQFVFRLRPLIEAIGIEYFGYSARQISEKDFEQENSHNYFRYDDSRDSGYSGTVERYLGGMNYGFLYTKEIRHAFNTIWGAEIE